MVWKRCFKSTETFADVLHSSYVSALSLPPGPSRQPLIYDFRHYFGLGQELGSTFCAEV
jgi:hypothetical protein